MPDRACLTGTIFVLKSGIPWEVLPQGLGCGSGMTCWRRLRDWQAAGVWDAVHRALLARLGAADRIDRSRVALDSASIPATGGGCAGPNPTDRGKPGTERHVVANRGGLPPVGLLTEPNCHDSTVFEALLDAIPPIRVRIARSRGTIGGALTSHTVHTPPF